MSAVPAETASMPADEPRPETRIETSSFCCRNSSPDCSAMGRSVVDPLTLTWSGRTIRATAGEGQQREAPGRSQRLPRSVGEDTRQRRVSARDPALGAIREEPVGGLGGACSETSDVARIDSCTVKAGSDDGVEVQSPRFGPRKCTKSVNELRHDFTTGFVVAGGYVGPDVGNHFGGGTAGGTGHDGCACRVAPARAPRHPAWTTAIVGPGPTRITGTQSAKQSIRGTPGASVINASVAGIGGGHLPLMHPAADRRSTDSTWSPWTCSAIVSRSRLIVSPTASSRSRRFSSTQRGSSPTCEARFKEPYGGSLTPPPRSVKPMNTPLWASRTSSRPHTQGGSRTKFMSRKCGYHARAPNYWESYGQE